LFTSFGYFETDQENFLIFHTAFDHLNFGGYFIIDYFNNLFIENNLVHQSEDRIGNTEVIQRRKIDGSRVVKNISIRKNGDTKNYFESVRMYSPVELAKELTRIGFVIEKTFGDFQGNKFDQYLSPRIIFIAKK
jgi:hypothetical protein